ncbi:unnamed protein product [Pleuronectes platessa]|uniref:S100P-binding protein n=1 Tax=Pleuronectes platessa TaxID=8262 RepID=A0A9N7ZDF0_PLEPL|nr:unnamed protein product [Pleuronectes platessa]
MRRGEESDYRLLLLGSECSCGREEVWSSVQNLSDLRDMDESMKGAFRSTVFRRLTPAISNSFTDHCSPPLTVPSRSVQVEYGSSSGPRVDKRAVTNSSEQSRKVTEELQHSVTEPVYDSQATFIRDTATVQSTDTSYEATLSPQVQVKSVVVALRQSTTSSRSTSSSSTSRSKTTAPSVPELKDFHSNRSVVSGKRKRLVDMGVDWECKKQSYVHSVTKHMEEHPTTQDVMTELFNLITHVAERTSGGNGRPWQHPSDLTRRNYQRRFGNMNPRMSLCEWQQKNSNTYKRFANIPKIFERSLFH